MNTARLMLVDTASLYFRAFYGLPDSLTAADGRPVNAVRGLLDFLARFIEQYSPRDLVCCWDNDWRPQWRVDLLPSYKTHRVAAATGDSLVVGAGGVGAESGLAEESPDGLTHQVPMIRDVLAALGIAVLGVDGAEADDVIGTLAARAAGGARGGGGEGQPVDVVTGDRDLFQLVDDRVRVLYVARGVSKHEIIDDAWLRDRYGITGAQYADFATLRGDPSDGIPGVAGVGEKTAASLLARFGDLEGIVAGVAAPDSPIAPGVRAKLAAAIDYLGVGREVVGVRHDLPLPDQWSAERVRLPASPVDSAAFERLTDELNLGSSAQRIVAALAR